MPCWRHNSRLGAGCRRSDKDRVGGQSPGWDGCCPQSREAALALRSGDDPAGKGSRLCNCCHSPGSGSAFPGLGGVAGDWPWRRRSQMNETTAQIKPTLAAKALARVVEFYQGMISPGFGPRCRYLPTCSEYARTAIERFGAVSGSALAVRRLLRCQPLGSTGFDPVPPVKGGAGTC